MSPQAPRRFLGGMAIVVLTVGMLLVFALAIASVLQITSGDSTDRRVAAGEADDATGSDPDLSSSWLLIDDAGVGWVACERATSGGESFTPGAEAFVLAVDRVAGSPDPLTVEVRLSDGAGGERASAVRFGVVDSTSARIDLEVPDSGDPSLESCSIAAIQRGDRVVIIGL